MFTLSVEATPKNAKSAFVFIAWALIKDTMIFCALIKYLFLK